MNDAPDIVYLFERYPVLSQTFLRREIEGLRANGLRVEIYSMLASRGAVPAGAFFNFKCRQAGRLVYALPRELMRDPSLLRDGWRLYWNYRPTNGENFWSTVWAVIFAFCCAGELRRKRPGLVHGVWATGPATAAAVLSRLCGVPFTFGAHAYDLHRHGGDAFLEPKLRAARFVHTSTEANVACLRERANGADVRVVLARRGLGQLPAEIARDAAARPVRLLSVGRLVAKKGHRLQIAACAVLRARGVRFHLRIVGDGPLREELERQIDRERLGDAVELCGEVAPERVEEHYRWADAFWHTGVVDPEGDRDGLPNVIPEAFSYELPVITNCAPGATEAVADGVTGLVVDATDTDELADAVERLADDPALRRRLGEAGRDWVAKNFLAERNSAILAAAFREAMTPRT